MECLLPHDALHSREGGCIFYAGFSHTGTVELNNGVIGWVDGWPGPVHTHIQRSVGVNGLIEPFYLFDAGRRLPTRSSPR